MRLTLNAQTRLALTLIMIPLAGGLAYLKRHSGPGPNPAARSFFHRMAPGSTPLRNHTLLRSAPQKAKPFSKHRKEILGFGTIPQSGLCVRTQIVRAESTLS